MYNSDMKMSVSEFRRQCLSLLDQLPPEGITLTRHGKPIARITPVEPGSCAELIGSVPGLVFDNDDDLFSTGIRWDAES